MSTLGKILIAFQVVLSILFMMFAGMVSATHTTWKDKYAKAEKELKEVKDNRETIRTQAKAETEAKDLELKKANQDRDAAKAEVLNSEQELARLRNENKQATLERASFQEAQTIAGNEAKARTEEARTQREVNEKLLASRKQLYDENLKLQDQIRSMTVDLNSAQVKLKDNIDVIVGLRKKVAALSLAGGGGELASDVPPPPVGAKGVVMETRRAKSAGGSDFIMFTLGSDDGILKGHTLFVFRPADGENKVPKYIGQVKVVSTEIDTAVGEVLKSTVMGVIQKGDRVTTKL